MKVKGNGQAKVLTSDELGLLFTEGLTTERDRCLFAICLFTCCRISEALALDTSDIQGGVITFRKGATKGKLKTRTVEIQPALEVQLAGFIPVLAKNSLFLQALSLSAK